MVDLTEATDERPLSEELEKLAVLKQQGLLTDNEFQQTKPRLVD